MRRCCTLRPPPSTGATDTQLVTRPPVRKLYPAAELYMFRWSLEALHAESWLLLLQI